MQGPLVKKEEKRGKSHCLEPKHDLLHIRTLFFTTEMCVPTQIQMHCLNKRNYTKDQDFFGVFYMLFYIIDRCNRAMTVDYNFEPHRIKEYEFKIQSV